MSSLTELQYLALAIPLIVGLIIGYMWGRANGMQAERHRRRRVRSVENKKSRVRTGFAQEA